MGSPPPCNNRAEHGATWVVTAYKANYSAFNGYARTPSDYSEVTCGTCHTCWRTKAAYVDTLPINEGFVRL